MKNVSAAIVVMDNKILLTRRAIDQNLAGYWEFPGGKQEDGETIEACLEREIIEELGVRCVAKTIFYESLYEYPGGAINLIGIEAELSSDIFSLKVHDQANWVPFPELLKYMLAPADIPIAERILIKYGYT